MECRRYPALSAFGKSLYILPGALSQASASRALGAFIQTAPLGVRRQSAAATAFWMVWSSIQSGVALRLPPTSKSRFARTSPLN
ncbi:MAG: hypothetical protein QOF72_1962 [Blastocatellia bacterium]|nr:hypothetical protein [Blastocatellia bacterium]